MPKWYVTYDYAAMAANRAHGTTDPVICVRKGKSGKPKYGHEVILPIDGSVKVLYDPLKPIMKDQNIVIECDERPVIIERVYNDFDETLPNGLPRQLDRDGLSKL